jgi:large subunit ribosomal protein L10
MAVTRAQKEHTLEVLKNNFKNAKSISFTSGTRMTVAEMSELRKNLRTVGSTFMLEKKTLMRLALKEVHGIDMPMDMLPGQVAVVCSNNDAVAGMGKVNDFMKEKYAKDVKLEWVACYFEGQVKGKEETKEIAAMPSRETLLSRLVGSLQSPIAGLARFFDAASKKLDEEGKSSLASSEVKKKETPKVEEVKEEVVATEAPVEAQTEEVVAEVTTETSSEEVVAETSTEEEKAA